jgi:hypothetical protein
MSDTLKLTPTESVIVRRSEPDLLEVEGIWGSHHRQPEHRGRPNPRRGTSIRARTSASR